MLAFLLCASYGSALPVKSAASLMWQNTFCTSHEGCSRSSDRVEKQGWLHVIYGKGVRVAHSAFYALHNTVQPSSLGGASLCHTFQIGWTEVPSAHEE